MSKDPSSGRGIIAKIARLHGDAVAIDGSDVGNRIVGDGVLFPLVQSYWGGIECIDAPRCETHAAVVFQIDNGPRLEDARIDARFGLYIQPKSDRPASANGYRSSHHRVIGCAQAQRASDLTCLPARLGLVPVKQDSIRAARHVVSCEASCL